MPLVFTDLDDLAHDIEEMYANLSDDIIKDIARRIKSSVAGTGNVTATAALQTQILSESGELYDDILKKVAALSGKTEAELRKAFAAAGVKATKFDDKIYRAAGLNPLPLNLSRAAQQALVAGLEKTGGVMRNLAMSMPNAGQQAYLDAVDRMYMQVSSGAVSYTEALRHTVKKMAADGVKVVKYTGKTDQIDVAMRRALLTGISQTANRIQIDRAYEMGSDLIEVSAHIGARPSHQVWQGKVYSLSGKPPYKNFVTETGYGTGDGLGGWNCRHSFYPFFEGLSEKNYSKKELDEYEDKKVKYNGEEMSFYDGTQKQREIEREIRHWKRQADAVGAAGLDNQFEVRKYHDAQVTMRDFIKQTGLMRQPSREGFKVLKIIKPGFTPPHWVPGMGPTTHGIAKWGTTTIKKFFPPAPKVAAPKKPIIPPAPLPPPPVAPAPPIDPVEKMKRDLLNKLNAQIGALKVNERQIQKGLTLHLADPVKYKALVRFDPLGKLDSVLVYSDANDYYVIHGLGEMHRGMGQDTELLHDLFAEALKNKRGIAMVLADPNNLNADYFVMKQYFESLGIDVQNLRVNIARKDISAQWITTFGQDDLINYLAANPLPGIVPVGLVQPPVPPLPPVNKPMIYDTAQAVNIEQQKTNYLKYLQDMDSQGKLTDPVEKQMLKMLEHEKAGVSKVFPTFDNNGNIYSMVEYTSDANSLSIEGIAAETPVHKRDALKPLWEEALLEGKSIKMPITLKAERQFWKGLGMQIDPANPLGPWKLNANEVKDSYVLIWGQNSFAGFRIKFPAFVPMVPQPPTGPVGVAISPLPAHLKDINDGDRFISQDGKTIIVGTNKHIYRGAYEKAVVDIEGNGRALIKANYDSQGHLGWGDSNYTITEGFAYRETAAYEVDELLHLGITPKTEMFISQDGRTWCLVHYVNGDAWTDVQSSLKYTDFLKLPQAPEEQAKLALLDLVTGQKDRNGGNWMVEKLTGKTWAIDNGLSFINNQGATTVWKEDRWRPYRTYLEDANGKVVLDRKYRQYLKDAIDNGTLRNAFKKAVTSDLTNQDLKILDAAMKRAREIVADWDTWFIDP